MDSTPTPVKPKRHLRGTQQHIEALLQYAEANVRMLSWLLWASSVIVFVICMHHIYHPLTRPALLGLIIRSIVFALWGLVLREWFEIRL